MIGPPQSPPDTIAAKRGPMGRGTPVGRPLHRKSDPPHPALTRLAALLGRQAAVEWFHAVIEPAIPQQKMEQ